MPIDPQIPLRGQFAQFADPLEALGKVMSLKQLQQRGELQGQEMQLNQQKFDQNQATFEAAKRKQLQERQFQEVLQRHGGDVEKAYNDLASIDLPSANAALKGSFESKKAQLDHVTSLTKVGTHILQGVHDQASLDAVRPGLAAMGFDVNQLPAQYDPEAIQAVMKQGMDAQDMLKAENEKFSQKMEQSKLKLEQDKFAETQQQNAANAKKPIVVNGNLVTPEGTALYSAPKEPRNIDPLSPQGIAAAVAREKQLAPLKATQKKEGRGVLSGDAHRLEELDTSLNDLATLRNAIPAGATGALAKAGAMLPNAITEYTGIGTEAKQKQAVIDRVKQVIGKALEGGVLRKEDEYKYEKILPTIGDPADVAQKKLDGLETAIKQRKSTTLDSLDDAGFNVDKYRKREQNAAPPTKPNAAGWRIIP